MCGSKKKQRRTNTREKQAFPTLPIAIKISSTFLVKMFETRIRIGHSTYLMRKAGPSKPPITILYLQWIRAHVLSNYMHINCIASSYSPLTFLKYWLTYLLAGKFTPAANVEVHVRTHSVPWLYASSINFRSSIVSPPWWYAMPYGMTSRKTGQSRSALLFSERNKSRFSFSFTFFNCLKTQFVHNYHIYNVVSSFNIKTK